jgi:hypothetical protein
MGFVLIWKFCQKKHPGTAFVDKVQKTKSLTIKTKTT